ncbi:hypothetical protein M758_8G162900 [Ceratodon purpureus]|nr:hypothetical protein M758_8G162900 [Ceratodon purpureus]
MVLVCEQAMESNHRLSDANVKDDHSDGEMSGSLEDDVKVTDKGRRKKQQSPTKRRKIEHESSLLFEGPSSMTAAELLAVNELANGVRQRLAASEHSTSEIQASKSPPTKPLENSKDALISSIFYVFDICGENGLSASEVVKYMLDHRLPGLKEGGARHTVQVANVLRSSSSFISLGDKKYLLCSSLDARNNDSSSKKPTGSTRHVTHIKIIAPASPQSGSDGKDSSDDELEKRTLNPTPRRGSKSRTPGTDAKANAHSHSRSGKKVQAEKPKSSITPQAQAPAVQVESKQEVRSDDGEAEPVVVKTTRRRGPSSSQKGKGPTQCKRYDGRGWQCSRLTEPGYSLCVHHQDLINKRAAKLKEQQTLNRLMESQHRKLAKSQPATPTIVDTPKVVAANNVITDSINGNARDHRDNVRDRDSGAPVQKRKMLSLLAIK